MGNVSQFNSLTPTKYDLNTGQGFSLGANNFNFENLLKSKDSTSMLGADTSFSTNNNFSFNPNSAWDSSGVAGTAAAYSPTWWDKAFGGTNPKTGMSFGGFAAPAVGLLQAGLGYSLGKDQLDLSKDQLSTSKQQFADQFNTQTKLTNMDIQDHAKARYLRDPVNNADPSTDEWAKANLL